MIKKEELKVGLLVWWNASRYMREWSCPAIVTKVSEDSFQVKSLDDFKETGPLRIESHPMGDESSLTEMTICTLEQVKEYFKNGIRHLEDEVTERERSLSDAKESLAKYQQLSSQFIAGQS